MESRHDSENAERILYNMNPKQLVNTTYCSNHYIDCITDRLICTCLLPCIWLSSSNDFVSVNLGLKKRIHDTNIFLSNLKKKKNHWWKSQCFQIIRVHSNNSLFTCPLFHVYLMKWINVYFSVAIHTLIAHY